MLRKFVENGRYRSMKVGNSSKCGHGLDKEQGMFFEHG